MVFTNVDPNNLPITVTNQLFNFGWEYVWHCHLLGHEENDMMRPVVFKVDTSLPKAPVLTATRDTGVVNLAWTDPTPAADPATLGNPGNEIGFRVERATLDNNGQPGAYTVVGYAKANSTSYADFSVSSTAGYAYRVFAYDVSGSTGSNTVTLPSPPAAPSQLTATAESGPQVRLSWQDNSGNETGFVIERSDSGGAYTQLATAPARQGTGNTVTYTDPSVVAGGSYRYRVAAENASGLSAYATSSTVTIPSPPADPSNLTATAVRNGSTDTVTLRWTDNANNETGFTIQRSTSSTFSNSSTSNANANATSFQVQNLQRTTTYYFRVRADNNAGSSAWVVASVTTP
jgi:hypothetical protein